LSQEYATELLVDGQLVSGSGDARTVINPTTGGPLAKVPDASAEDADRALLAADRAWPEWAARTPYERGVALRAIAAAIQDRQEELAQILVAEVGKPISQARGEAAGTARFFSYVASLLETLVDEIRYAEQSREQIWTVRRPHGVVAAIIPWNFPLALVARKVAPAIGAGNAIVLKADEKTPLTALAMARLISETGVVPPGVVNILTGGGAQIGQQLVTSPLTQLVTMTGSSEAGKAILAAAAPLVKPVSLELGGNAPFVVLPDADLELAVADAVASRHLNAGQACIANERTFVHVDVYEEFVTRYVDQVSALVVGDPADPGTDVGPKISEDELAKTLAGVKGSVDGGARLRIGGERLSGAYGAGFFMSPAVLTEVTDEMPAMRDELFGPVTPITTFTEWGDVRGRANATRYGLSAYVYTKSLDQALRAVQELSFGEVYINRVGPEEVNGYHIGYRESGLGGDDGPHGLDHYSRRQTVYLPVHH
jgi:lactaldehyde dehydrogenase / glycolaldehyde dehydrogenase